MADTNQGFSGSQYKPSTFSGGVGTAVKDKAKELASSAGELAEQAKEKVQDWAGTATTQAKDLASAAVNKVSGARSSVGEGIESLADKIRDKGPHEGMLGTATSGVADTMHSAGAYLRDHDFSEMGKDVTNVIRRYPVQSLLIGIGLGFLLARATRSQS